MKQTVCLVGRPNVGKSSLFNRIVGKKISIIEDTPGVTRDRICANSSYDDKDFYLIDTGGLDYAEGGFNVEIKMQVEVAIQESDVIIFIVDGKEGLTSNDILIRDLLKKSGKKVVVAINKVDSKKSDENIYDFYSLGFEDYVLVSAEHGSGVNDLLDIVVANFYEDIVIEDESLLKFCLVGRPNVGKSSLVNALHNEERVIVSEVPGTTRDAIDTKFVYDKDEYILIDTAGLRKKGKIFESIEKYSLLRSLKAIDRSDVCMLILDAETGIIEHDKHIASYILEAGKALVIVVNKWDVIDDKDSEMKKWKKDIEYEFQFLPYAKIVFLSALTKKRIHTLMPEILNAYQNTMKEVDKKIINEIIRDAYIENPPAVRNGKKLKIYYANQVSSKPPRIDIEVNSKALVHFSYKRYLENRIRENIDFSGTPIQIEFKNKGEFK